VKLATGRYVGRSVGERAGDLDCAAANEDVLRTKSAFRVDEQAVFLIDRNGRLERVREVVQRGRVRGDLAEYRDVDQRATLTGERGARLRDRENCARGPAGNCLTLKEVV